MARDGPSPADGEEAKLMAKKSEPTEIDALVTGCRAVGVELPPSLHTRSRRWQALLIVFVALSITSAPVMTFSTLEPILIEVLSVSVEKRIRSRTY